MQPKSTKKTVAAIRAASRNTASLVLFGRAVVITLSVISAWLGFLAGIRLQSGDYDPHAYAIGAGALFAGACAVIAFMLMRRRFVKLKMRVLEARIEELSDRNWELREAEERARSLLEAQGDLIVRRDAADSMHLSARGYHRVLRVARTLADLDGAAKVGRVHLAEALSYRALTDEVRRAA